MLFYIVLYVMIEERGNEMIQMQRPVAPTHFATFLLYYQRQEIHESTLEKKAG